MKRFKRWLIHKLGGVCKDECFKPNIIINQRPIKKLTAEYNKTSDEDVPEDFIKSELCKELGKCLCPFIDIQKFEMENKYCQYTKYMATVEIVGK